MNSWIASAKPCWTLLPQQSHQLGDVSWDRYGFLIKMCPKEFNTFTGSFFANVWIHPQVVTPKKKYILNHPEMKKDSDLNQTSRGVPGLHFGGACSILSINWSKTSTPHGTPWRIAFAEDHNFFLAERVTNPLICRVLKGVQGEGGTGEP